MCYARSCAFIRVSTYSRDLNKLAARKSENRSRRVRQSPQNSMKSPTVLLITLACVSQSALAVATYTGGIYAENFDGEHARNWVQDSTLPGWFAYRGSAAASPPGQPDDSWQPSDVLEKANGQGSPVGLLNLGTNPASLTRSLGSRGGPDITFALVLRNDTLSTFGEFTLNYFGEQWQVNTTAFTPGQKLDFSFGIFSSFYPDLIDGHNQTIVPNNGFDPVEFYDGYTIPIGGVLNPTAFVFGGANGPLDGTAPENRRLISSIQTVEWLPGEYLVLRWFDEWAIGEPSAMLAINDLQFEARAIPEPSAALLTCFALGVIRLRRTTP